MLGKWTQWFWNKDIMMGDRSNFKKSETFCSGSGSRAETKQKFAPFQTQIRFLSGTGAEMPVGVLAGFVNFAINI